MATSYDILRRPRITEKGSRMAEAHPVVVFEVPIGANKIEIKRAVQTVFNVEVDSVRTLIVRGKTRRRGKFIGKRSNWKKAIVSLAAGQSIDFFGGAAA
jgi:large subunit ribosomal protein L23